MIDVYDEKELEEVWFFFDNDLKSSVRQERRKILDEQFQEYVTYIENLRDGKITPQQFYNVWMTWKLPHKIEAHIQIVEHCRKCNNFFDILPAFNKLAGVELMKILQSAKNHALEKKNLTQQM